MNFSRRTSGEEGLELLRQIRARHARLPVILVTAWGSIELAVEGMKLGATDFITKPWNNQHVLQLIDTSLQLASAREGQDYGREELDQRFDFSDSVGDHPALLKVLSTIGRVCQTDAPVLILGESGTGKELIAEALHRNSQRSRGPLVKVNLGGIPDALFEAEMFGHVRGAFTDARSDRRGRFQLADGGTIFLDEVGELEPASQVKLLRVLEDRSFQPVGSSHSLHSNVRIVAATNRDLNAMTRDGSFREDLLYRLNLITVRLPPLRERSSDIRRIARHHLLRLGELYGAGEITISEDGWRWLESLPWPGNIRQLRQTIERAVLMSGKSRLDTPDFIDPERIDGAADRQGQLDGLDRLTLDQMEKLMIEKKLALHQHNISRVAESLGLSRAALYRRLEKHGLD
jgi:two-component system NtrC family response regulator